ncbi:MAG: chorismate-binding protein [Muribaculaceae bacterium]|nr:chorismate-binding protein [Muribaculaceae bacterium]
MGNIDNIKAVIHCLSYNIPFVYYILPDETEGCFFANPSMPGSCHSLSDRKFIISPWLSRFEQAITICDEVDALQIHDYKPEKMPDGLTPFDKSTSYDQYIERLSILIKHLASRNGKTVISRTICGDMDNVDIQSFIKKQFESFPQTFRYIYFTPQTGAWLGTSPEILLEYNYKSETFRTMALAGTRPCNDTTPWDEKTIEEQNIVTRFISSELDKSGVEYTVKRMDDYVFPPVKHICDIFTGKFESKFLPEIINRLNPTPALGGYPVDNAIEDINRFELHPRRCYGGFVAVCDDNDFKAYVNLRCMNFSSTHYCIYTGGGITSSSDPEAEWIETENKSDILRRNIAISSRI